MLHRRLIPKKIRQALVRRTDVGRKNPGETNTQEIFATSIFHLSAPIFGYTWRLFSVCPQVLLLFLLQSSGGVAQEIGGPRGCETLVLGSSGIPLVDSAFFLRNDEVSAVEGAQQALAARELVRPGIAEVQASASITLWGSATFSDASIAPYARLYNLLYGSLKGVVANQIRIHQQLAAILEGDQFFTLRIEKMQEFLAGLPEKLEEVQIRNSNQFLNNHEPSIPKFIEQYAQAIQDWVTLYESISLPALIRELRQRWPSVLHTTMTQNALKKMIIDGVAVSLQSNEVKLSLGVQPIIKDGLVFYGWAANTREINVGSLLSHVLPGFFQVPVNFDHKRLRGDLIANLSYSSLVDLMTELLSNSRESAQRRMARERERANFIFWEAWPNVGLEKRGSKGVIVIEDLGSPEEYLPTTSIGGGVDSEDRTSVGMGRFKIEILAHVLGLTITHRAKVDGSGSIFEVEVPNILDDDKIPTP